MTDQLFEISLKLIIVSETNVLCLQRWSHTGDLFWDLPGGRMQTSETDPMTCLRRETRAEVGDELSDDIFEIGSPTVVDFSVWPGAGDYSPKGIIYYALPLDVDPGKIVLSAEHARYGLLSVDELESDTEVLHGARLEPELKECLLRIIVRLKPDAVS